MKTWRARNDQRAARTTMMPHIGVGDGGQGAVASPPPRNREKYFSDKNHVKFGHFVNISYMYFRAKMSCPPKLTELLRL